MATEQSVDLVDDETVTNIAIAAVLAALTAALAQVSIPVPGPVPPISFQVFGVYFAALLLGPKWAGFSIGLYLLVGLAGAPVFSNFGAGIGYAMGYTGGYLLGFFVAAVVIGAIVHQGLDPRPLDEVPVALQAGALFVGLGIIYAVGVPWMAYVLGLSLSEAAVGGAVLVFPGDVIKIAATLALVKGGILARHQSDLSI